MNSIDMAVTLTKEKQEYLSVLVKQIVKALKQPYLVLNMEDSYCFSYKNLKTLLYVNV